MEIKISGLTLKLEFSFLLLLSFAALYGYGNAVKIILFSFLHELGHFAALLFFGIKPYVIKFSFYGLGMKYYNILSADREFIVILCGPLINLLLFLILKDEVNLVLFILNTLPICPLDGGRLLKIILPKYYIVITYIFLAILFLISFYVFIEYKIFSLLLITVYLLIFNASQKRFI